MNILSPSNLDMTVSIKGYVPKYYEKYAWIIHCIIERSLTTRNNFNGYVNLNKQLLARYVGERFVKKTLCQLQQSAIIEINPAYKAGFFSMSYRLTKAYRNSAFTVSEFIGKKVGNYLFKLNRYNQEQLKELMKQPTLQQLHYNVHEVKINEGEATKHIDSMFADGTITEHQHSCCNWAINSISTGTLFFKRDDHTGRIYHNIAGFPRVLRQYLSYNDEQLWQIDVSNCQVVFILTLIG